MKEEDYAHISFPSIVEVILSEYQNIIDARTQIGKFIHAVYNRKQMHSSLHALAPNQFEREWRHDQCAISLSWKLVKVVQFSVRISHSHSFQTTGQL